MAYSKILKVTLFLVNEKYKWLMSMGSMLDLINYQKKLKQEFITPLFL